jgi:RHS repeat-associated protein
MPAGTGNPGLRYGRRKKRATGLRLASRVITIAGLAVVLVASGLGKPALAAPVHHAPKVARERSVPVHAVASHAVRPAAVANWKPSPVTWPTGSGEVTVTPGAMGADAATGAASSTPTRVGNMPVWVGAPAGKTTERSADTAAGKATEQGLRTPIRLRITAQSQGSTAAAGVTGALYQVDRLGAVTAPGGGTATAPATGATGQGVDFEIGTRAFRDAYGADYASRLRLVTLPACALTTPDLPRCRTQTAVTSTDDVTSGRVSGTVQVPAAGASLVVAADSAPSGGGGDFTATSLQASGSWQSGGSNGGFEWTYPISTPSVPGGLTPQVALSYASQSLDGLTSASNTQGSWIGDGWDYQPGFVERSYESCSENPAGPTKTGDDCWSSKNTVTLSLNGQNTTLVKDDSTGVWHPQDDNAERVQLLTGASNGAYSGEYWVVTDAHGTKYYFGQNRLPGYAAGNATTNSVFTEPVFATASGQPCYNATFANSYCANMAYRWNLDYVVDTHSDVISYFYKALSGVYSRDNGTTANATYTRGGYLIRAQYGQRDGQVYTTEPAAQVLFNVTGRCNQATCDPSTLSSSTATNWPDVPYDLHCVSGSACSQTSPSFWSEYRLASIQTQVLVGTTEQPVDSWSLSASFPPTGDTTTPAMWLDSITRTGQAGGTSITLPPVTFIGQPLANRVNLTEGYPPITRRRLQKITTETGEQIGVDYSSAACASGVPSDPSTNTSLCYPVYWTPLGQPDPIMDWFNKYYVTDVSEQDETAGGVPVKTHYAYQSPAWHRDDSALTPDAYRTWSDWRGFKTVQEFTGQAPDPITENDYTYFQGMNGDALKSGGTRTATISDSRGDPAVTDEPAYAGMTYEQVVNNGSGGAVVKDTITNPWQSAPTATHAVSGLPSQVARLTGEAAVLTYTPLAGGGNRVTEVDNTYDSYGRTTQVDDKGDTSTAADDKCTTTTYATNPTGWILDAPNDVKTVAVNCAATPSLPSDLVSDVRSYYDGSTTFGDAPTKGDVTMASQVASYTGSTPNYVTTETDQFDQYGRITSSTDADNFTTFTGYTPSTGAEPTQTTSTDPMGHVTTTQVDPRRDLTTQVTDAGGYTTRKTYDALGRVTAQWNPGRPTSGAASAKFSYLLSGSGPSTVTTQELNDDGSYRTAIDLYDALLRPRETQTATVDGGRTITDTVYNSDGWKVKTSDAYYNSGVPSNTLVEAICPDPDGTQSCPGDDRVPSQTGYVYDGAGRELAVISYKLSVETWRTTYVYGGNFTTVVPPKGGVATTTFEDAREQTTDIYQYHSGVPIDPLNDPAADYDHIHYGYTPDSAPASLTDAAGNTWTRTYNLLGQQISESDPDTGVSTSTYDNEGHQLSTTDARGKTTSYTYDPDGRKTASYDTTGGAPENTSTQIAGWTYDTLKVGYPTSSTSYVGGNPYTVATVGYNSFAEPTGTRVTLPSTEGGLAPAGGYATAYTYNNIGDLATQTDQAAGGLPQETITYGHDSFGQDTSVKGIWDYLDNTVHTAFGEPQQYVMGPSTSQIELTLSRDEQTHNLTEAVTGDSTTTGPVDDLKYTYDPSDNVTSISDKTSTTSTDTQCFTYDYGDRLSAAWTATDECASTPSPGHSSTVGGPMPYWQSWTFDAAGNRLTQTDHDTAGAVANDTTTTYHYPSSGSGAHQLSNTTATGPAAAADTNTLTYDTAGNTKSITGGAGNQTLTWNNQGKLETDQTTAGTTSYVYDADGNLMIRRDPGQTTLYLDDEELVLSGGTVTGTRYYSVGDVTIAARTSNLAVSYLIPDRQGTDTLVIDSATQAVTRRHYLPYGQTRGAAPTSWPGDKGYVGGTTDATTSLVNLGQREYAPALGRFLSSDAILEAADPKQLTGYDYAGNNPVTHSDPSGMMIYDDVTHAGYGSVKNLSHYYHKNKKQYKKILANERRSYNAYYHSAYYRAQSSPAYQKAYMKYLRSVYDQISRANYPPKPKPKPHKSFWGKIGHAIKKYTPAALSAVSVVSTVLAFTPICAAVCLAIAAAADGTKGAIEAYEGNRTGAIVDLAAAASFGVGEYVDGVKEATEAAYYASRARPSYYSVGSKAWRAAKHSQNAAKVAKRTWVLYGQGETLFKTYNLTVNSWDALSGFLGIDGAEGGE